MFLEEKKSSFVVAKIIFVACKTKFWRKNFFITENKVLLEQKHFYSEYTLIQTTIL